MPKVPPFTFMRGKKIITFDEYFQSKQWLVLRARVFKRDGYRCILCNGKNSLQCHHRTYRNVGSERMEDLTTLCFACHTIVTSILRGRKRIKSKTYNIP